MPKKVIVAMSGGVDSSVAAALLKRAGFDVMGVFLKLCQSPKFKQGEKRAKKVAQILKIPFKVLDLRKKFKKIVIDYFLREYRAGRTPNPCVVCNKEIKFSSLFKLGADFVATGHHARLREGRLFRAKDKNKDQSYFLWRLSQKQLKRVLFPLGNYTKKEVRNLAKKWKLPVFNTPESQDICFTPPYFKQDPGPIVCVSPGGTRLGRHQGLAFYTIGQRKGIGLAGGPFWVLGRDSKKNLILTKNEKDLYKKELVFKNANWLAGKPPKFPLKIKAKIRYRSKLASAVVYSNNKVVFNQPQRAITPGQSVVFYKNQELLGGGIITR